MKLSSFSVLNYRSITTARKIQTNDMTVLVGKNNEGKSNILRALSLAMNAMKLYASDPRGLRFSHRLLKEHYIWERDYPISLQERNPNGASQIDLNFELTDNDIAIIRSLTGIRVSGNIPVRVSLNSNTVKIDIPKRGTPAFSNAINKQKIIEYVCFKIEFNFIPAVRTEKDVLRVVESLIENNLSELETTEAYINATNTIEQLQQEVLNQIANHISAPLRDFLPRIESVEIHVVRQNRMASLRKNTEVIINDGTPTPIEQKGDGIKSLIALAMLNTPSQENRVSVVAIEEPESHLHPESARQLYETIVSLTANHQVVLTTHSPLFIDRSNLKNNIIVDSGKANPVKKIKDIRDILGTKVSDNLINAENVLIVEGENDKIILEKILPKMSESIKKAIHNGTLIIDYMGGTGNLPYKLSFYRNIQCNYHVLLDNDDAGRRTGQNAENQGLLNIYNTTYTVCDGSPNSEFEDCLNNSIYHDAILNEFGVDIGIPEFRGNKKWSERMAKCFLANAKLWDESIEKRVKLCVATAVPENPTLSLNEHRSTFIDALIMALNRMID